MLYDSIKIYMTDLSRNLLDHFFHLGIRVSYDRVLEITTNIYACHTSVIAAGFQIF